jgi:hypothetical protein
MDVKKLISRGHLVGGGMISPDRRWFILSVPKNASSYTTNVLSKNKWQHHNLSQGGFEKVIIPLRDPVERWVSGTSTYCCSYILGPDYGSDSFCQDYNPLVQRLIVENMIFDDHTAAQSVFDSLVPDWYDKIYVWVDRKTFFSNIGAITGLEIIDYQDVDDNNKDSNYDTSQISNLLKSVLNDEIRSQIKLRYFDDYRLIESAKIYGR